MPLPATLEAEVYVSLDGSGAFDGKHDRLLRVKADTGITIDEGRDGVQQLSPPKIQAGDFDLSDEQGLYSPDNAASPYYQRLIQGRPIQYLARHGEPRNYRSHVTYRDHLYYRGLGVWPLGRHVVDDLDPSTEIGNRRVSVATLGWETVLTRSPVTVPLMVNPRVDQCFTALLDAAGWPADKRDISVADTTLLLWWCDERTPWEAMVELLAAEGPGAFGVRRDGTFYFENRNYRTITPRSTTSQATFYDRIAGERTRYRAHVLYRARRLYRGRLVGLTHTNLRPLSPLKNIFNRATYTTRRRATGALQKVWEYGASLVLTANQSRALYARPSDPFVNAVAPAAGTDYTVTAGSATVTLTYSSGFLAIITVTAGPSGATIDGVTSTGIQLRAQPLTVLGETTVENSVDASESIATFSPIPGANVPLTLPVQGWPEVDPAVAEAVCNAWVLRQREPRPLVTFSIRNGNAEHLERILRCRVSDRVTLINARTGLHADFWINATQLRIADAGGRTVELRVSAERCDTVAGAVWDVSLWDTGIWGV